MSPLSRSGFHPVQIAARAGYGARGVVYLLVGGFAAMAAVELRNQAAGADEAMEAFVRWPLGPVWLGAVATGLAGFVVWRLLQAVLDADQRGSRPADLLFRTGQAFSAVLYAALAWSALNILDGVDDIRTGDRDAGEDPIAAILELPLGEWLLFLAAAVTAVAATGNLAKAVSKRFGHELACDAGVRAWAAPVGRAGYAARGLVFAGVAFILAKIALKLARVEEATLGATLQEVEALPFGSPLLFVTGLALGGFGLFGLVEARYRRIRVPDELEG